jgi:Lrp/AsnC family transcriptional regulator
MARIFDRKDREILDILQDDASRSVAQVAERIGLSQNACWRRIKLLESDGVITRRVALVDAATVGVGITVFVSVRTSEHSAEWLARFAANVVDIPEVVEFYRMSGEVDYLLKLLVADIADYDRVYKKLINRITLSDVSSSFAMERIKHTTRVPIPD